MRRPPFGQTEHFTFLYLPTIMLLIKLFIAMDKRQCQNIASQTRHKSYAHLSSLQIYAGHPNRLWRYPLLASNQHTALYVEESICLNARSGVTLVYEAAWLPWSNVRSYMYIAMMGGAYIDSTKWNLFSIFLWGGQQDSLMSIPILPLMSTHCYN